MGFNDAMRNDPRDQDPQDQIELLQSKLDYAYLMASRFQKYLQHSEKCKATMQLRKPCHCGLGELLSDWEKR